jgi:hypothetical protein
MMTLKEFGENLKNLNEAYERLRKKYQKPEIGKTIEVAGIKWMVLDKFEKGYLVISDEFYGKSREFDTDCNNWDSSDLRRELNTELRRKIEEAVGEGGLLKFTRDLLSMDGQTEYGSCEDYVSIISVDEYRKYRKLLPNTGEWWWTLTPDSTKCNDDTSYIRVVSPSGNIFINRYGGSCGVRPFCIFSSSIFESCEEDDN